MLLPNLLLIALTGATKLLNAEKFIECLPDSIFHPSNTGQVVSIINDAIRVNSTVKAYGAGHSTNRIMCSGGASGKGGIAILTANMNSILSVDEKKLQVTVYGGMALERMMNELIPYGFFVPGVPDFGRITVAGAIATGAHGSSLRYPSALQDYMIGATIVTGTGQVVKLTAKDADFPVLRTHLGALGIMTEVTLQGLPLQKLKSQNYEIDFDATPETIVEIVKQHDFAGLYYFSDNKASIMHTYDLVPKNTTGEGRRTTWDPPAVLPWAIAASVDTVLGLVNNLLSENELCAIAGLRAGSLKLSEQTEPVGHFGPMYMGVACTENCVSPPVDDMEIAIPLNKIGDALRDISAITSSTKACFPVFGVYTRFGLQGNTVMGPTADGPVAYLEIHILRGTPGKPHLGFAAIDEIRQLLLKKYNGQPHFGKNFVSDFSGIADRMPAQASRFLSLTKKYDPKNLFSNDFLESFKSRPVNTSPGCAARRECFCSADEHCFSGWKCGNARVFSEAKVCRKGPGIGCARNDECASGSCRLFFGCK